MSQSIEILILIVLINLPLLGFCQNDTLAKKNECELKSTDETIPEFPGGINALKKYLESNTKYPKELYDKSINGKIFIQFIIDSAGSIINPEVLRGLHPALDSTAIIIIKNMPKWKPAFQNGKPVSMKFVLPIKFSSESGQKK